MSLADCEERIGKFLAARSHYNAALSLFSSGDERIPFVQQRIAELVPRIPRLTLQLAPDSPAGTTVELNGFSVMASELGEPIEVDPGMQTVVVAAPGRAPRRHERALEAGQTWVLTLVPGPPTAPQDAPKPRADEPQTTSLSPSKQGSGADYTAAFVVGGISLGLGVAAVALSVRAFTHYGDLAKTCASQPGGCPQGDRDAVASEALASNVLYGVAGAGAIVTIFLFAFAPQGDSGDTVSVVPGGDTVDLRLRF